MNIGHWSDGRAFIVLRVGSGDYAEIVCWTPTVEGWGMIKQLFFGIRRRP